ncbi:RING-H2 finger protein ATL11-like [Spinacia oleracea]|uniref:RING-type E3 ubiquitin transferase n=1 Tax=Spinacia oleracea TaxID=3562 RepID=A0ABM3QGI2_SPIOL|nr:RING-H2 finger protein ATL11-like [Spinacia oleracea]
MIFLYSKKYYNVSRFFIILIIFSFFHPRILVRAQYNEYIHGRRRTSESSWGALNEGLLIVVSVVLLVVVYYLVARSCLNRHRGRSAQETAPRAQVGLDSSVLETFPVIVYPNVSGLGVDKGPSECAVCLSLFEENEKLRMLPKCKHVFHLDCVNRWLAGHTTCPFCRDDLAPPPQPVGSTQIGPGCVDGSGSRSGVEANVAANNMV